MPRFFNLKGDSEAGRVFVAPLDVVLSRCDVVEPDVLFVAADRAGVLTEQILQRPPSGQRRCSVRWPAEPPTHCGRAKRAGEWR
jgi:hypothetical protein